MNIPSPSIQFKLTIALALLALAFVIGFLMRGRSVSVSQDHIHIEHSSVKLRADTAVAEARVNIPPINVSAPKKQLRHTAFMKNQFTHHVTELDTLIHSDSSGLAFDTIKIQHIEPDDSITLAVHFALRNEKLKIPYTARDSVAIIYDSVTHTIPIATHPWYEQILMLIGAVVGGYLVGKFLH